MEQKESFQQIVQGLLESHMPPLPKKKRIETETLESSQKLTQNGSHINSSMKNVKL